MSENTVFLATIMVQMLVGNTILDSKVTLLNGAARFGA